MRRVLIVVIATLMVGVVAPANATPVATNNAEYDLLGRIFPDPQAGRDEAPGNSPYAKGDVPAADFIQLEEFQRGTSYLEEKFPGFVEFYRLHKDFNCQGKRIVNPNNGCKKFRSAGLPVTVDDNGEGFVRERRPLFMTRITDESVPNKNKKFFVFPLSIHGIERAGVEGGTRAAEDLATWGACEKNPGRALCQDEDQQPLPHPLLEATPNKSITAGRALRKAVVYFIYPNPDGWLRGDRRRDQVAGSHFYQRYNGNGVDLNRDWPTLGFTFRPYTPWSEPETRSFGKILKAVGPKDASGDPKWAGGIDLHGQLIDRAFSFTLIGGAERPYGKNQRVLQTVKGAWADAEKRLAYSPLIKPNDAPPDDPRVYGVQWGTVWDTIDYTITGGVGDWIDSSIGLNGDGIDNEMSMSHLINCGVGTCFEPDAEQLHVDGNKSLVYSMLNYSLKPERKTFNTEGRVGYLFNRGVVKQRSSSLSRPPQFTQLPPQQDIEDVTLNQANEFTHEFQVQGPPDDVYNGGIAAQLTCGVAPVSTCAVTEARLEKRVGPGDEEDPNAGEWQTVSTYFNQSPVYLQAGQALHANLPKPGQWRVVIEGAGPTDIFDLDINFTREKGWPDPGQVGFRASSMKFWKMLKNFARPGLEKVTVDQLDGGGWRDLDTLVVTNKLYDRFASKLRRWVADTDGNLVLTDSALRMLPAMNITEGGVDRKEFYAGYVNFATKTDERTYGHPLAHNINQDGAAEGQAGDENHRRQTYEPVPLGISIQNASGGDASHAPVWYVDDAAWSAAEGTPAAVGTTGNRDQVSYGEIAFKGGRIRIIGALLPNPTKRFDHPFGLADYALTYSGYQLLKNTLSWTK
jgi:hypothetical protein